jgi:hypothetical protein
MLDELLQPVIEMAFQAAGYLTGYVVVPVFTLGTVFVEPDQKKEVVIPSGGSIKRRKDGVCTMHAELGTLCGLIFWFIVAACFYMCWS